VIDVKLTAATVYSWFRELVEQRRRAYRDNVIHVSEVAGCLRRAWYERVRPQPALDPNNVVIMVGNGVHEKLQELLAEKGWQSEVEAKYKVKDFWLVGHADLYHPEEQVVLELKTSSKVPEEPYRGHALQINSYIFMLRAKRGYIVYVARDGGVKVFEHRFDKRLWSETVKRAMQLHEAVAERRKPPAEKGPHCRFCPYKWYCFAER
jgi:CRISPR-associated exonuclease Cas4